MDPPPPLPRVTIQFCTQCKWMLRAAYFAQELLSTFSTDLGEVALQPATGGIFKVHLYTTASSTTKNAPVKIQEHLLWDRKTEGGFPETKILKRLVRDIIAPTRDLGHVDHTNNTPTTKQTTANPVISTASSAAINPPLPSNVISSQARPPAIPRAINRLLPTSSTLSTLAERKFTPMDIDLASRPASRGGSGDMSILSVGDPEGKEESRGHNKGKGLAEKEVETDNFDDMMGLSVTKEKNEKEKGEEEEVLNSRGKIIVGGSRGEGSRWGGFCRPGDEDCG